MLFLQNAIELVRQLFQHEGQVDLNGLQLNLLKIISGNIKKFIDQFPQPDRFFQGDMRYISPAPLPACPGWLSSMLEICHDQRSAASSRSWARKSHQVVLLLLPLLRLQFLALQGRLNLIQPESRSALTP